MLPEPRGKHRYAGQKLLIAQTEDHFLQNRLPELLLVVCNVERHQTLKLGGKPAVNHVGICVCVCEEYNVDEPKEEGKKTGKQEGREGLNER